MSAPQNSAPMKSAAAAIIFALTAASLPATASMAKESDAKPASSIAPLLACRTLQDMAERVRCYDARVDDLQKATANNELVVMDKEDIKKTKRSLFGFTLPRLSIFSGSRDGDQNSAQDRQITAKLASLRGLGYGKWAFQLDDGARWETTEALSGRSPKSTSTVVIRQGALGSYMAEFDEGRAVRVKRVN